VGEFPQKAARGNEFPLFKDRPVLTLKLENFHDNTPAELKLLANANLENHGNAG
jgi:hypothetical protein